MTIAKYAKPVVFETHGGFGKLFATCYAHIERGIVIEKNPLKAQKLLEQRGDRWAVYEGDTEAALREGIGGHLPVNFLDVDPYGDPWPIIEAFFESPRTLPEYLMIVVNDGLRQRIQRGHSWKTATLKEKAAKYGNGQLHARYLDICREFMTDFASPKHYKIEQWAGYYVGYQGQLSHYAALLKRSSRTDAASDDKERKA